MEKTWCLKSATGINPNPWGSVITDTLTFNLGVNEFTQVNEITQVLKFKVTGKANVSDVYNITTPAIAWIKQINTQLELYSHGTSNTFTVDINSQTARGDVAYALQLEKYSYGNYYDNELIEFLNVPTPQSLAQFDVARRFKFDIDWADKEDRLLPIKTMKLEYTWKPQSYIFQPPINSPNFLVSLLGIDYYYPKYKITQAIIREISPKKFNIPTTRIYSFQDTVLAGAGSYSKVITIPGSPIVGSYYFLQNTPSSQDGLIQGKYSLNPNDASIISSVRMECGGINFPVTSSYNSKKTATENVNWIRHYDDYQKLTCNWETKVDSIQTSQTWLNKNRIYKVGFSGIKNNSNISVNLEFAEQTLIDCNIIFFITYKDESLVRQLENEKMPMDME